VSGPTRLQAQIDNMKQSVWEKLIVWVTDFKGLSDSETVCVTFFIAPTANDIDHLTAVISHLT
jgi:hypothetical protein